jgi:hypothetical protein
MTLTNYIMNLCPCMGNSVKDSVIEDSNVDLHSLTPEDSSANEQEKKLESIFGNLFTEQVSSLKNTELKNNIIKLSLELNSNHEDAMRVSKEFKAHINPYIDNNTPASGWVAQANEDLKLIKIQENYINIQMLLGEASLSFVESFYEIQQKASGEEAKSIEPIRSRLFKTLGADCRNADLCKNYMDLVNLRTAKITEKRALDIKIIKPLVKKANSFASVKSCFNRMINYFNSKKPDENAALLNIYTSSSS